MERLMPSVLQNLKEQANPDDYDSRSFAMLHCASAIRKTQLEGMNPSQAFDYVKKIVAATNKALDDTRINQHQKQLCTQAIQDLIDLDGVYNQSFNAIALIQAIKKRCEKNGTCYLPTGWVGKPGHYVSAKIVKNANNTYSISYLNRGGGMRYHDQLGKGTKKTKYDYQSHVYNFDLDSDEAKLFFHGLVELNSGKYIDNSCDENDLYGLLALHGELTPVPAEDKRKVTKQRSGTCTVTDTRLTVKDVLLFKGGLSIEDTKRYEFFNKLTSIVAAYKHLKNNPEHQKDETELQLLELAINELYVRLEKAHPKSISDEELKEIREYADTVRADVQQFQNALMDVVCKEIPLPAAKCEWHPQKVDPDTSKTTVKKPAPPVTTPTINIRKCPPDQVDAYIQEGVKYFSEIQITPQTAWEFKKWMRSLAPTTGNQNDPYWDAVPSKKIPNIIHNLTLINKIAMARYIVSSTRTETYYISYDIAAQIAPRVPELKLDKDFCLGLDDTISDTVIDDPDSFLNISRIAQNFIRRSEFKAPIFTQTITKDESAIHSYVEAVVPINNKEKLEQVFKKEKPTDTFDEKKLVQLFLTNNIGVKGVSTTQIYPENCAELMTDIRVLSCCCQNGYGGCYYETNDKIPGVAYQLGNSAFTHNAVIANTYSENPPAHVANEIEKFRQVLPFNQIPTDKNTMRDLSENAIYQPVASRIVNTHNKDNDDCPWSHAYDGNLQSSKRYLKNSTLLDSEHDEDFKRMQLDKGFVVQRILSWLDKNIRFMLENKTPFFSNKEVLDRLFQYGSLAIAFKNSPEETHQQMKKTLHHAYNHLQAQVAALSKKFDDDVLKGILYFCTMETMYRAWACEFNKSDLLDNTFPNCQQLLRNLLGSVPKSYQGDVAQTLIANLKTLSPLSDEDLQYLLASQLIMMHLTPDQLVRLSSTRQSFQASEAWNQFKEELKSKLQSMDNKDEFVKQVLTYMGYGQYALEFSGWQYQDSRLISKDGRAVIDLNNCRFSIDGAALRNINNKVVENDHCRKILTSLNLNIHQLNFITRSTPDSEKLLVQFEVPGDSIYYLTMYTDGKVDSLQKNINIGNQNQVMELMEPDLIKIRLEIHRLENPYQSSMFWYDSKTRICLALIPNKPKKALLSDSMGMWHEVEMVQGSWQKTGTVLPNPNDTSIPLVAEWNKYLERFCDPTQVRYKAQLDSKTNTLTLTSIKIPDLDLHFDSKDGKLYCREYKDFYLSTRQAMKEFNGLSSVIILENKDGKQKFLLPKGPFKDPGKPFYSRDPVNAKDAKSYVLIEQDDKKQLKAKSAEDNLRIAITLALQGDYQKAMKFLQDSYSHRHDTETMVNLIIAYNAAKPNTPSAYAFYYHLYQRHKEHEFKWTKDYEPAWNPTPKEQILEYAMENLQNYADCISAEREDVDIIPEYLQIPKEVIESVLDGHPNPKESQAFIDQQWDEIIKTRPIPPKTFDFDERNFLGRKKRGYLPFYPPIRVSDKEQIQREVFYNRSEYDDGEAFILGHWVDLFELAISEKPIDQKRFKSYMFHIVHTLPRTGRDYLLSPIRLLWAAHHSPDKERLRNLSHDNTNNGLMSALQKFKLDTKNPPELFPARIKHAEKSKVTKVPHWLKKKAKNEFSLNHLVFDQKIAQPLAQALKDYYTEEKKTIAVAGITPQLQVTTEQDPIVTRIIDKYQQGYKENLSREHMKYSLKTDALAQLSQNLDQTIQEQRDLLATLKNKIAIDANRLPEDDPEFKNQCDLIKAARQSGKRPLIDENSLIMSLLNQKIERINYSNPFLNQQQINELLQLACNYALEQSKLAQCQEALDLINKHKNTVPLPHWVEQLIGETLAKKRTYNPQEYPEILVYEYATNTMLREGQAEAIIKLIKIIEQNPQDTERYRHALLQFKAAGGKTAVLIPILANRFARKRFLPVPSQRVI